MKDFANGYIYNIQSVQPIASVCEIELKGWVYAKVELEHLGHHHECINLWHHHLVPRKPNQYRKIHKKPGYKLCLRDEKTDKIIKRMKLRTYLKCNHHPEPNRIFNLVKSIPKNWQTRAQRKIYQSLVKRRFPHSHCLFSGNNCND